MRIAIKVNSPFDEGSILSPYKMESPTPKGYSSYINQKKKKILYLILIFLQLHLFQIIHLNLYLP